jgi:RND family efflux transporter MFP subunit
MTKRPLAAIVGGLVTLAFFRSSPAQEPIALVVAAKVVKQELTAKRTSAGSVSALRESIIGSAVDGRVVEFPVNEGDRVQKGDVLCQLRTEALVIELARAQAQRELQKQILAELNNGSRPEEIAHTKALMLAAKSLAESSQSKLERLRTLIVRQANAVTVDELRDVEATAINTQQLFEAARAQSEMMALGPRQERILQAAANVAVADETVREIQDRLEQHTIRAPFDGYIVEENAELGQWIAQGAPVVRLIETDVVEVDALVLETQVAYLAVGDPAVVELRALPDESFQGAVSSIVPFADPLTRQFPVKIRLENRDVNGTPLLKPGMFAQITLPAGRKQEALFVPKDALFLNGNERTLFVIESFQTETSRGKVQALSVETGISLGSLIAINSPLPADALVVVEGNERIRTGQEVQVTRVDQLAAPAPPATEGESAAGLP